MPISPHSTERTNIIFFERTNIMPCTTNLQIAHFTILTQIINNVLQTFLKKKVKNIMYFVLKCYCYVYSQYHEKIVNVLNLFLEEMF